MKAMYSVYDRTGDCFDFCDDEETEGIRWTMTQSMTGSCLAVERRTSVSCGENNQINR
jgi:hypothetical protein